MENRMRRAWILNDVNEALLDNPIEREILVDYNNFQDICIIINGVAVSPTKELRDKIRDTMISHKEGDNQHLNATEQKSGFMSSEDKIQLKQNSKVIDYIKNNNYLDSSFVSRILNDGVLGRIEYTILDNKLIFKPFTYLIDGSTVQIDRTEIPIPERPDEGFVEKLIVIEKIKDTLGFKGKLKMVDIDDISDSYIRLFEINRHNKNKFSPSNPYGSIGTSNIDDYEILPLWHRTVSPYVDFDKLLYNIGNDILDGKYSDAKFDLMNIHFGTLKRPINENTLVYIDMDNNQCIDGVSRTNLDKDSNFILGPTGLSLYHSDNEGINLNLPSQLENIFTLDFIIKSRDKQEPLFTFKDSNYKKIFNISLLNGFITLNDQKLIKVSNFRFEPISLVFNIENKTVDIYRYSSKIMTKQIELDIDLQRVFMFELTAKDTILSDIRLVNSGMTPSHYTSDFIHDKAILLPPIINGHRKLSNNVTYQYNSIKVNYNDLGLIPDENGVKWHAGDTIKIDKNTFETIAGVFKQSKAMATIIGIDSNNNIIVDNINKFFAGDFIKIVKYNKNILETFKILDVDYDNKILVVMNIKDASNPKRHLFDKSIIEGNIFDNSILPSIEIKTLDGQDVNYIQYPNPTGNIILELEENIKDDYLIINYLLITEYGALIPVMKDIQEVSVNNIVYNELTENEEMNIDKGICLEKFNKDNYSNVEYDGLYFDKNSNGNKLMLRYKLDFNKIIEGINPNEISILNYIIEYVNIELDIASNKQVKVNTNTQSTILNNCSDVLRRYQFKLSNNGTLVDNEGFMYLNMEIDDRTLGFIALRDFKASVKLKSTKENERIFMKPGSNSIADMLIVGVNGKEFIQTPYVKTIFSKQEQTNILLTSFVRFDKIKEDVKDFNFTNYSSVLKDGSKAHLIYNENGELYILIYDLDKSYDIYKLPDNMIMKKVGEIDDYFV